MKVSVTLLSLALAGAVFSAVPAGGTQETAAGEKNTQASTKNKMAGSRHKDWTQTIR